MGYMTTLTILNDCMDQIKKNPEQFVEGIFEQYYQGGVVSVGNCANPVEVMSTHHADDYRLYVSGGNATIDINPWNPETKRLMDGASFQRDYVISCVKRAKRMIEMFEDEYSVVE